MQPGSRWEPLQLWRTALAEAWSTEPDLGRNVPTGHFQLRFWPSTTQSFTCRLIQTSDTVIEWGPLNGLNLYNTERERQGWDALRKGSTRQTAAAVSRLPWQTCRCRKANRYKHNELQEVLIEPVGCSCYSWLKRSEISSWYVTILPQFSHKLVSWLMEKCRHVVIQRVHVFH